MIQQSGASDDTAPDDPETPDYNEGCGFIPFTLVVLIGILTYISYKITEVEAFGKSPLEAAKVAHANWLDITSAALCVPLAFLILNAANKSRIRKHLKAQQAQRQARTVQSQARTMEDSVESLNDTIVKLDRSTNRLTWVLFIAGLILGLPVGYVGNLLLTHALSNAYSVRKSEENITNQMHMTTLDLVVYTLYLLTIFVAVVVIMTGHFIARRAVSQAATAQARSGTMQDQLEGITDIVRAMRKSSNRSGWEFFIACSLEFP